MELDVIGNNPFDSNDARNRGVIADQLVGTASGTALRRIIYVDPVSGEEYSFLTTEMKLPPGVRNFDSAAWPRGRAERDGGGSGGGRGDGSSCGSGFPALRRTSGR